MKWEERRQEKRVHEIEFHDTYLKKWEDQGWMHQTHAPLFKVITSWVRYRSNTTQPVWVKGHNRTKGNEEADRLAGEGALKDTPTPEIDLSQPTQNILSGTKLSTLTQRDFYRGIKKRNPPPPRRTSKINLGRIQVCAEEHYDTSPTFESIWKVTKHKDLTKKTREFLCIRKHGVVLFDYFAYLILFPAIWMLRKCQNIDLDYLMAISCHDHQISKE